MGMPHPPKIKFVKRFNPEHELVKISQAPIIMTLERILKPEQRLVKTPHTPRPEPFERILTPEQRLVKTPQIPAVNPFERIFIIENIFVVILPQTIMKESFDIKLNPEHRLFIIPPQAPKMEPFDIKLKQENQKEKNNVTVYTGPQGPKIVLKETIEAGRKGEKLMGFGTDEDPYKDYLPAQIEEHFKDQKKYKIKWHLLFTKGKWSSPSPLAEIRYLPKGQNIPVRTMIYGNKKKINAIKYIGLFFL